MDFSRAWVIEIGDGSGNGSRIEREESGVIRMVYDPVTPRFSSSGSYSGGEVWVGELTEAQGRRLWELVLALVEDSARHWKRREMGTGSLRVVQGANERRVIVGRGDDMLAELLTELESLRGL